MNHQELREEIISQNPALGPMEGAITVSRLNFWKMYDLVYNQAFQEGMKAQRRLDRERAKQGIKIEEMLDES